MAFTALELKDIAASGGGIILDAKGYTTLELREIAIEAFKGKVKLTLKNVNSKTAFELRGIATAGKGCVVFDFT